MNNITQNINKNQRYLPHELKTRYFATISFKNGNSVSFVCRKYHISKASLYRWIKKFDGTKESLKDGSHRPLSPHPKAHTNEEIKWIKDLIHRNPNITLYELWYKLRKNKQYKRHPASLYRKLKRIGYYSKITISGTSKYIPQPYHTPEKIGEKWQIDVKYVPKTCKDNLPSDLKFYQYTCIDEASRERYIFHYTEHTPNNTVDFVKRCFIYYSYKPREIQTDNGTEFTWNKESNKVKHPLDVLCDKEEINHHKIRPRTPRHNGKVERSHRNDNNRFYSFLKFTSLEDLRAKAEKYIKRSNNIPMGVLKYLTPIEKRNEIIKEYNLKATMKK